MAEKQEHSESEQILASATIAEMLQQLPALQQRARATPANDLDATALAERVIDAMARRQGHTLGPYFEWSLATADFESRFNDAAARKSPEQSIEEFVRAFVDAWPTGMAALRLLPDQFDPIANPPYSKDGLWPAYLEPPG